MRSASSCRPIPPKLVQAAGGKVLGSAPYPFPGTSDFSSFLVQAQSSGAKVLGLANAGGDTVNSIKQANEFGINKSMSVAALLMFITDVHALGLETAKGLVLTESYYWDLNDGTRNFCNKIKARSPNNWPNMIHAGCYSATLHYLKTAEDMGAAEAKKSGVGDRPAHEEDAGRGRVLRQDLDPRGRPSPGARLSVRGQGPGREQRCHGITSSCGSPRPRMRPRCRWPKATARSSARHDGRRGQDRDEVKGGGKTKGKEQPLPLWEGAGWEGAGEGGLHGQGGVPPLPTTPSHKGRGSPRKPMITIFGVPAPLLFGQLLLGLINGAFYAMLSLGLAVIFGMLNIINFAHGALFMMGAFAAWMLLAYGGIGYFPALILAPLIIGAFGILLEKTLIRRMYKLDHLYGLLLTFGLALVIEGLFRNYYGSSGLPYRIPDVLQGATNLGFMYLPNYRAWVVAAALVVCFATWAILEKTSLGATLRAATENAPLVQAFGVDVPRVITLTFGGGVALAAFAGVLAAPIYSVNPNMGDNFINTVFAVVVIGGMGSILGAILTGFGLGVIEGLTKVFWPQASATVVFLVMVIVLAHHAARPVRQEGLRCSVSPARSGSASC